MFVSKAVDDNYLRAGGVDRDGAKKRVDDHLTRSRSGPRGQFEQRWRINLKWFSGEPFYRLNTRGELEWISPRNRKDYTFVDVISPRVRALQGYMTYPPQFEARPAAASDIEDVFRARAAADVTNHGSQAANLAGWFRQAGLQIHLFGLAWGHVGFDVTKGPVAPTFGQIPCPTCKNPQNPDPNAPGLGVIVVGDEPMPCPHCGAEGIDVAPGVQPPRRPGMLAVPAGRKPQGEVFCDVIPPWEVFPDPEARDLFDLTSLVHEFDCSRQKAFENWGKDAGIANEDEFKELGSTNASQQFNLEVANIWGQVTDRKYVRVSKYFEIPSSKFPDGLEIVLVGGELMKAGPMDLEHHRIPYIPLRCHVIPGALYPLSTTDYLLPHAIAINDHMSNLHMRAGWDAQARIMAPKGMGFRLSDEPGVVEYQPMPRAGKPEPLNMGGSIDTSLNVLDRLDKMADDVSGASNVLRGDPGVKTESARHAALLEERATGGLKPVMEDNARSLEQIGKLMLETIKLFYGDGRTIQIFGATGHAHFRQFRLTDVGSSDDVVLSVARDLGRSKSARRAELVEMAKAGVMQDPTMVKMLELSTEGELHAPRKMHASVAEMENDAFRKHSVMPSPTQFQDHGVHAEVHLPLHVEMQQTYGPQSPQAAAIEDHLLLHEQIQAQEETRKQMAMQQAAAAYGMVNAADPNAQPATTQTTASDSGMAPAASTEPAAAGPPGPPESQQSLQQVDQSLAGMGQ